MKKIYSFLFACVACMGVNAASYTITISGTTYSPAALTVTVGDVVTIQASSFHPLVEVDQNTWNANGTASVSGGWGVKTADHTFTVTTAGDTYFVCQMHASVGMKGQITAVNATGLNENASLVKSFNLFPNPAATNVKVNFSLTAAGSVSAKLINILGQEVDVMIPNTQLPAENHSFNIDLPANLPNGPYFVVINANEKRITKKLVINK